MSNGLRIVVGLAFIAIVIGLMIHIITVKPDEPDSRLPESDENATQTTVSHPEPLHSQESLPPTEAVTIPISAPSVEGFRVFVEDCDGRKIAGAKVAFCDPHLPEGAFFYFHGHEQVAETDHEGIAEFSQTPQHGHKIVAVAQGYLATIADVETSLGNQLIQLASNVAISGTVLVDGHPPRTSVRVMMTGFRNPLADAAPSIRRFVSEFGCGDEGMEHLVETDGCFSFRGLAAGTLVTLEFPSWYRLRTDPLALPHVEVITPRTGLIVELESIPSISGKPVEAVTQEMAVSGDSSLNVKFSIYGGRDQTLLRSGRIPCRVGQVFRIPYEEHNVTGAELSLWNSDRTLFARREAAGDFSRGRDLGDIPRESLVMVRLSVFGISGIPVPDARGEVSGHVSEKTGVNGMVHFPVPGTEKFMRVGAPGYEIQKVALDLHKSTAVAVNLQTANSLSIEVRQRDGSIPSGFEVRVDFDRPMLENAVEHFPEFADVKGTRNSGASFGGERHSLFYPVGDSGKVVISNITPLESFSIELLDRHFHILRQDRLSLSQNEKRSINWTLPTRGRSIRGIVIDEHGQPLQGARIRVGSKWWSAIMTAGDGSFSLDDIYEAHPRVRISLDDYAVLEDQEIDLSDGDLMRTYQMTRARTLWIKVLDRDGKPHDVDNLSVSCEGHPICGGVHRGKGLYQVDKVAIQPAQVIVHTARGKHHFGISAEVRDQSIVVE